MPDLTAAQRAVLVRAASSEDGRCGWSDAEFQTVKALTKLELGSWEYRPKGWPRFVFLIWDSGRETLAGLADELTAGLVAAAELVGKSDEARAVIAKNRETHGERIGAHVAWLDGQLERTHATSEAAA